MGNVAKGLVNAPLHLLHLVSVLQNLISVIFKTLQQLIISSVFLQLQILICSLKICITTYRQASNSVEKQEKSAISSLDRLSSLYIYLYIHKLYLCPVHKCNRKHITGKMALGLNTKIEKKLFFTPTLLPSSECDKWDSFCQASYQIGDAV